ncbi:MAG: hypothetical protein Q9219_007060 [cf. Caloplaca sp. 3 TL-2023]
MPPEVVGFGSCGIVYQITKTIAVKVPRVDNDAEQINHEYNFYDLLEEHPTCSSVLRSFYRIPFANFLEYMSGGSLEQRLRKSQTRDHVHNIVIKVDHLQPAQLVWRWTTELTSGIAWLEHLGYARGDLRPSNLLLDGEDHLKISDFDSTTAFGKAFDGMEPPYARVLGDEAVEHRGTFGYCGPRTEQFAIGLIVYYMTRGFEVYDNEWLGEDHETKIVDRLQAMIFPPTDPCQIDEIIRSCWYGRFDSIRCLNAEVVRIAPEPRSATAEPVHQVSSELAKQECRQLISEGILDSCPRDVIFSL